MKKRILALGLTLSLSVGLLCASVSAAGTDAAVQTVRALGIMNGDNSGNLNLSSSVTRAEFAAMLTSASSYQDSISGDGAGYSLFRDVKSSHWASEYIRLAVQQGWMVGYTDGSFRPDRTVTLEEACSAALKLLGYDASSLAGSFPSAQLSKAAALGLRDDIARKQGEAMTRQDCALLFYNLLTAQTSGGRVYAETLGYSLINGEVDYAAVTLQNLSGPYVAQSGDTLPFTPGTIYRNGTLTSSASLNQYDVYYYNQSLDTAWICTDRVSGKITALSPSLSAPTAVTISGSTYQIGSSTAAYQLSALSGSSKGETVTLLLDLDGAVVEVLTGAQVDMFYYGVVADSSKVVEDDKNASVQLQVSVTCTDGVRRTFTTGQSTTYSAGDLVAVSVTDSGVTIQRVSEKHTSGKIRQDGTKLGSLTLAADVEILDTAEGGSAVCVRTERLAGCTLDSGDVRYYVLNESGEISRLILDDVTGDVCDYGYLLSAQQNGSGTSFTASYSYLIDGRQSTLNLNNRSFSANSSSAVAIRYGSDGSISSMRSLASVRLTALGASSAQAGSQMYALSDNVQVYLKKDGACYATSLSAINAADYTLTGWYDDAGHSAGGLIRVIIAVEQ